MGVGRRCARGRSVGAHVSQRELGCAEHPSLALPFLPSSDTPIYQKDVKGHFGCVNAIEASLDENYLASGGDDRRVLMWSVASVQADEQPKPIAIMRQTHYSNIFSVAFSNKCERLYSAGNDTSLLVHDISTLCMLQRFKADEAIYNVATNPIDDTVIMSASEDGRVRLYDLRAGEETIAVRNQGTMYCAQFNPRQANLISVCNGRDGLSIHDCRKLDRPCFRLGEPSDGHWNRGPNSVMYGQWSDDGDAIFATRSQSSPIYYNLNDGSSVEFNDSGYLNSCTVKSCSFISHDLVMTGSDDWNIYVWKIPQIRPRGQRQMVDEAYRILKGHRSIVNHARYSAHNRMLFSSGVEKIIKVWSGLELRGYYNNPVRRSMLSRPLTGEPRNDDSTEEDLNMLAFFDLLTTNGGEDEIADMDEDDDDDTHMGDNTDDDNWLAFARIRSQAPHQGSTMYVISSPELSEAELLSVDNPSEHDEWENAASSSNDGEPD
uniref:DDB1-and CUL4-associated factor 5 n=1 Tax=Ascaris suum TaxID=6253 RepID=F1KY40_ASCSU